MNRVFSFSFFVTSQLLLMLPYITSVYVNNNSTEKHHKENSFFFILLKHVLLFSKTNILKFLELILNLQVINCSVFFYFPLYDESSGTSLKNLRADHLKKLDWCPNSPKDVSRNVRSGRRIFLFIVDWSCIFKNISPIILQKKEAMFLTWTVYKVTILL